MILTIDFGIVPTVSNTLCFSFYCMSQYFSYFVEISLISRVPGENQRPVTFQCKKLSQYHAVHLFLFGNRTHIFSECISRCKYIYYRSKWKC